jgi:hypothetical protein
MATTDLSLAYRAPDVARSMAEASLRFLATLTDEQRATATFPFAGDERYQWHYTPVDRNGLWLKAMTQPQREAALALFDTGLSARGVAQVRQIIDLEPILRETERIEGIVNNWRRDPERYYFSIFGEPGGAAPWAWRAGGHHIGLHFTVIERDLVAPTPLFFGANPAEVRHGPQTGLRTLPEEEDLARAFLASLESAQKATAIVDPVAPDDILTKNYRQAAPDTAPAGIAYSALAGEQRERLVGLVRHYVERGNASLSATAWTRIEQAGLELVTFAWAGRRSVGRGITTPSRGQPS